MGFNSGFKGLNSVSYAIHINGYVNRLPIGEQLFSFCIIVNRCRQTKHCHLPDRHTYWLHSFVSYYQTALHVINALRTGSFKLFKRPLPGVFNNFNPLNAELNPICYLLALWAHHFLHVSRIRVKSLTLRLLMSYIYDISSLRFNQLLYCVSLKIYNKFANYFCELKFLGNTHQRP